VFRVKNAQRILYKTLMMRLADALARSCLWRLGARLLRIVPAAGASVVQ
jgi:hypothetical protein